MNGIVTAPQMFEVKLGARGSVRHGVPASHNAFIYVFDGEAQLGPPRTNVGAGQLAVLPRRQLHRALCIGRADALVRGPTHR